MPVLKLQKGDEDKEIDFEISFLKSLTTKERFYMMLKKSEEMKHMMRKQS